MFTGLLAMFKIQPKLIQVTMFLSSLIGLGFVYGNVANAQSAGFIFQSTVNGRCDFINVVAGNLGLSADGKTFSSTANAGSQASATLDCNLGNIKLAVEAPKLASWSDPFTIDSSTSEVTYDHNLGIGGQQNISATNLNPSVSVQYNALGSFLLWGSRNIDINMSVTSPTEISAGNYSFTVRFTAAAP
jgi:hypothetical protein